MGESCQADIDGVNSNSPSIVMLADLGNTSVKIAATKREPRKAGLANLLFDPVRAHWKALESDRISTQAIEGALELAKQALGNEPNGDIESRWSVASVRGTAQEAFATQLDQLGFGVNWCDHTQVPMPIAVDFPDRLGIDRLLAAWGAKIALSESAFEVEARKPRGAEPSERPIIVIQAGTAVTVDVVSSLGVFEGGAIMPGLPLGLQMLQMGTDRLPEVKWDSNSFGSLSELLPGKNTEQAMLAGILAALHGGIRTLIEGYRKDFQNSQIVVSGGDAVFATRRIEPSAIHIPDLVLRALATLLRS